MKRPLFLILTLALSYSALNADPLTDATEAIGTAVDSTNAETKTLSEDVSDLVAKYKLTNAGKCALLVVGTSSTGTLPIYFVPGPFPIASLQADLSIATTTLTVSNIVMGPDAGTYGKSINSKQVGSAFRFLLAGINQTPLGPGAMAIASLNTSKMGKGFTSASLINFVASDPSGIEVPICTTTGVITK